ncbi:hypothetical protein FACS1894123_04160 [Bacteroidia bacterium]|nr:hypothetical protein FACS1894123_04160 [Bacteroidia bacterium]
MIQSMTGFGKATTELPSKKISVEIKSLNGKQIDINTRIPTIYRSKEMEIRNLLVQFIERGKVDFTIYINSSEKSLSGKINADVVKYYYEDIKDLSGNLNIDLPSDWFSVLLRLPDAIKTEISELDEDEWELLKQTINEALLAFGEFRKQEGAMLEKVFLSKIENIDQLSKEIEIYEPERIERIKTKIQEGLAKIDFGIVDGNRFEQELIYYIERLDVSEEKSRLSNHLKYFLETMKDEKAQGRKLGFIAQEIGREINTLGSKSNHAAMQKLVVQMKDELEQIKEQILNVL